jgi:triosephosphate isomerase
VGHSERRAAGDSDETVHAALRAAAGAGLVSILCVGETERDAGGAHFSFVEGQLSSALKDFPKQSASKLVVAYEPVWAIGKTAADAMKPQELREMAIFIKKTLAGIFERKAALRVPILYGGSVEPENARALIAEGGVGGFLVGHASTSVDSFIEILKQCN